MSFLALAASPARADRVQIYSIQGADCSSCGEKIRTALKKVKGVKKTNFDMRKVELTVEMEDGGPDSVVLAAAEEVGLRAIVGAGQGRYLPKEAYPAGADVLELNKDGATRRARWTAARGRTSSPSSTSTRLVRPLPRRGQEAARDRVEGAGRGGAQAERRGLRQPAGQGPGYRDAAPRGRLHAEGKKTEIRGASSARSTRPSRSDDAARPARPWRRRSSPPPAWGAG
jgi:copper chaperone CopZ